jgi:hypothetical protein
MRFKAGDKVRVKKFKTRPETWNSEGKMDHLMGKVVEVHSLISGKYIIYDDVNKCRWLLSEEHVEPVNETIVIYRKDNETIALDKRTGKKAVAKCSPKDTFNFETGAKLAFDRLMGTPAFDPKRLYNGKIIFTKGDDIFKTGHIYKIENGKLKCPSDARFLPVDEEYGNGFTSIEEVKDYFTGNIDGKRVHVTGWSFITLEFIEVVDD